MRIRRYLVGTEVRAVDPREEKKSWWERTETRGVVVSDFSWGDVNKCLFALLDKRPKK